MVAGVLVGWGLLSGADEAPPATAPSAVAMSPVGGAPVDARVVLEDVAWGTRLSLTCTYTAPPDTEGGSAVYVLVVRTKDGGTERVGTWEALPGRTLQVVGATASRRGDIAAVEVRTESGLRLLEFPGLRRGHGPAPRVGHHGHPRREEPAVSLLGSRRTIVTLLVTAAALTGLAPGPSGAAVASPESTYAAAAVRATNAPAGRADGPCA